VSPVAPVPAPVAPAPAPSLTIQGDLPAFHVEPVFTKKIVKQRKPKQSTPNTTI
jgi:fermentation-respiration switch protein FrsA (DUF1100 family)